jgi:hypothetical protein
MIARTSLEAYDPRALSTVRQQVYGLILDCPMLSNRDIDAIGIEINPAFKSIIDKRSGQSKSGVIE